MQRNSKYKLDNLVEFTSEDQSKKHGKISGVLEQPTGYCYKIDNENTFVDESAIHSAYKPCTGAPRKARSKKTKTETTTTTA